MDSIPLDVRTIAVAAAALLITAALYRRHANSRNPAGLPYPPGPKPSAIPFIGNMNDMPSSQEWLTFARWGKEYGPLVMVNVMGTRMCIINSAKVASELLDARSAYYSDRPYMPMVCDLMGWDFNMGLQPYNQAYSHARKLFRFGFDQKASEEYFGIQQREITLSLGKLLQKPENFDDILKETTANVIMKIAFGYQPSGKDDKFVTIAEEAQLAMVSAARPGAYLVDLFPILRHVPEWVPGAGFQKVAREGRELAEELQEKPWAWANEQLKNGKAKPSFFTALMDAPGIATKDLAAELIMKKKACAVMYATGADTILASTLNFVLAMLHAPEVQVKAREELSRVIGNERLPTFSDRAVLPYIDAIVKETYRWEQVIPLGVPHRNTKDDVYEGYFIPEGTMMIANQWGIAHDEGMYQDNMAFRPERFLDVPDAKDGGPRNPNTIAFGWGRRICPGRFLAENQLFLFIATTLQCFTISPSLDASGKPIIPPRDYTTGMASRPKKFDCRIEPRNEELIKRDVSALEEE